MEKKPPRSPSSLLVLGGQGRTSNKQSSRSLCIPNNIVLSARQFGVVRGRSKSHGMMVDGTKKQNQAKALGEFTKSGPMFD